jgi:hypothetical protein
MKNRPQVVNSADVTTARPGSVSPMPRAVRKRTRHRGWGADALKCLFTNI